MIGTLEHIVSQMNINSATFTFEYGKRGYINVLEDELLLPAVIYDTESVFNLNPSQSGYIGESGRPILSFMYKSELDWTPAQHYDNCIEPAINAARQFISLCQASELIEEISVGDGREFINLLDKNTSGIQFPFSIKLRVDKNVCVNYTPADNCQPVILTINGVEVETILSGAAFPLKVTLDGTQSGTYNEATDTWEVESDQCDPIRVTFDNNLIAETSTDLNIDCSTYLNMAIVTGDGLDGNYIDNGSNQYDLGNIDEWKIIYITDRWSITDISDNLLAEANVGAEAYPWLAIWSTITVEEGTIENYCGGGTAPDGEFYINLVKVADVPSGGNASTIVTLDGVSAGTYDSINNTWEVVSNPCSDATYTIKDRDETTLYSGSIVSGGNLNQYIENTTVEVNDTSFADVPAQGYLNIPVEYENGTPVGTINAGVVEIPNPITQSGIAYQRPSLTGQITSYRTGDDAWNLANGVYDYTPPTYPTSFARLDLAAIPPFTTLLHNNAFGNKNRFTDDAGGQTYANDYVIDHLTGLGYYRIVQGASNNWDTNIDNAVASTQGGFTDWRVCNFQEYDIIADRSMVAFNYSPFNLNGSPISVFQTSTTRNDTTTHYIRYQITTYVQSVSELKSTALSSRGVLYVRNHYN